MDLQFLLLDNNQLSGFIPESLGALQNLVELRLSENQFIGSFPDTIASISSLRILWLRNNPELLGVMPLGFTGTPLIELLLNNTSICEPENPAYSAWLPTITTYQSSGISCGNREADSLALVSLYNTMGGPNWTDNANWLTGDLETWKGIEITLDRVSRINLTNNNLSGTLPDQLGDLRYLRSLELSNNNISGAIPRPVFELSFLETLFLQANLLTGELPPQLFNQISLRNLALGQNSWTGVIPPEIINLQNLEYLVLNYTGLSGPIPDELGFLRKMKTLLSLDNNQLTGTIPVSLGNMPDLEILRLQNNQLTGAVPGFSDTFQFLREFDLSNNQLTDLNDQTILSALTDFQVSGNYFEFDDIDLNQGLFADSTFYSPQRPFGRAQNYYVERGDSITLLQGPVGGSEVAYQWFKDGLLVPGANNYDNFIDSMDTTLLGTWILEAYSGTIPGFKLVSEPITLATSIPSPDEAALLAIYRATNGDNWTWNNNWNTSAPLNQWTGIVAENNRVVRLDLGGNNLTGSLPPEIGDLTELRRLFVWGNAIGGNIPSEIGNLKNLDTLGLSVNQFSGPVPEEIYTLTNLKRLSLSNTNVTGGISPAIANLTKLKIVAMWNNNFTRDIPEEFWTMTWLEEIYLGDSEEGGQLPTNFREFPNLRVLQIFRCNLSGPIPREIGQAKELRELHLPNNKLTGPVPDEITGLRYMRDLVIDGNSLNYLPDLTSLDSLRLLTISNNKFTYGDIIPNLELITENTGQQPFGDSTVVQGYKFESLRLDPSLEIVEGQQYQWYKDDRPIPDGVEHYYYIDNVSDEDGGLYSLEVTHPDVDSLILVRNPLFVEINEGNSPKPQAVEVISPNGDGINDEMTIKNIELYPDHRVLIYDVIGRLVYETTNYDNINNPFIGVGNTNGFKELPSGTYYYLIDVKDNKKNGTGYFVLKRK